ncbi:MAG: hypothetical protein LN413_03035 [Candidatus Thermoplasmatota archaeon]|nr:hypothetical protein [Candidatus Thermoplasmatota archaeon]
MAGKVLQDVPTLSFASGQRFTPVGALKAVADFLGVEASYPWLMGMSGASFRSSWSDTWGLDMTYAAPEDLVSNGAQALGLRVESHVDLPLEEAWEKLVDRLDASLPVLSCGLAGAPEFCIVYGYREDPKRLLVRSYFARDEGEVPFQPWIGWNYVGYGRNPLVLPERGGVEAPSLEAALQRALRFSRGEGPLTSQLEAKGLQTGIASYRAWIEALQETEDDLEGKAFNMALNLNALLDARRTASEFTQILAAMNEAWRSSLGRAADHYRHQVSALGEARNILYFPREAPEEAAMRAAEQLADPELRNRYADVLRAALEEENLSLEWIERATEE